MLKYTFRFTHPILRDFTIRGPIIKVSKGLGILLLTGTISQCSSSSTIENSTNGMFTTGKDSNPKCRTSTKKTVRATHPSITVSYVEPKTRADGSLLTNLAKTTIYYDIGEGLLKAKEIPAVNPKGGGKISEIVNIPLKKGKTVTATICVTATDVDGREG